MGLDKQGVTSATEKGSGISDADSKAMIELISSAGDPIAGTSLSECKRLVFEGISRLVNASTWIWGIGQVDSIRRASVVAVAGLDGGWQDDAERADVIAAIGNSDFQLAFQQLVRAAIEQQRGFTRLRSEIVGNKAWYASPGGKRWLAAGLDHFIMSFRPLNETTYSTIGLHRRVGEMNFSQRERTIVDVLFQSICWLHRADNSAASLDDLVSLTPRERQVLSLLLKGCARKDVAANLTLSQHTVADHLKEIYRKLRVNSRAELLAKFIPGRSDIA